jgi:hypothetical protein
MTRYKQLNLMRTSIIIILLVFLFTFLKGQSISGSLIYECGKCDRQWSVMPPNDTINKMFQRRCLINGQLRNAKIDSLGSIDIDVTNLWLTNIEDTIQIIFPLTGILLKLTNFPKKFNHLEFPPIRIKQSIECWYDIFWTGKLKYYKLIYSYPQLEYDESGEMLAVGNYKVIEPTNNSSLSAVEDGIWRCYDKEGDLKLEYHYENGRRNGFYQEYLNDTIVKSEGYFNNGKMIGDWKYFDSASGKSYILTYSRSKYGCEIIIDCNKITFGSKLILK